MAEAWFGFDLDGVIIRNPFDTGVEPFVRRHIADTARRHHTLDDGADRPSPDTDSEASWDAAIARDIAATFHARLRQDPVSAYDWDGIFQDVARAWHADPVPDVEELVKAFASQPPHVSVLPGAREALDAVQSAGYRVAALTNGYSRFQVPTLHALGILDRFDDVISPEEVGAIKPSARFFAHRPHLVAHIGDTVWHDVHGALQANVSALWVHPDAPLRATTDHELIAAAMLRVATTHPLRSHYPHVPIESLRPCVAGRAVRDVVALWLEQAHPSKDRPTTRDSRAPRA